MYKNALLFQATDSLSVFHKINILHFLEYVFVNVSYKRDILISLDVGVLPAWKLFCPLESRYLLWFLMPHFSISKIRGAAATTQIPVWFIWKILFLICRKGLCGVSSATGWGRGVALGMQTEAKEAVDNLTVKVLDSPLFGDICNAWWKRKCHPNYRGKSCLSPHCCLSTSASCMMCYILDVKNFSTKNKLRCMRSALPHVEFSAPISHLSPASHCS